MKFTRAPNDEIKFLILLWKNIIELNLLYHKKREKQQILTFKKLALENIHQFDAEK